MKEVKLNKKATIRLSNFSEAEMELYIKRFKNAVSIEDKLNCLEMILKDDRILECLLVSSEATYNSLISLRKKEASNKSIQQLFSTVNNYIKRSYVRPTPFGLFSSVNDINISQDNNDKIIIKETVPYIKLSSEVIMSIYENVVDNIEKFKDSVLGINPNIEFLKYETKFYVIGENPVYKDSSVVFYEDKGIIEFISKELPNTISNLLEKFTYEKEPEKQEKFVEIIKNLLKERVLYLDIYPRSNSMEEADSIIEYVKKSNIELFSSLGLKDIKDKLDDINKLFSIQKYKQLVQLIKNKFNCKKILVVNTKVNLNSENICLVNQNELICLAQHLVNMNQIPDITRFQLERYKGIFIEKYGKNRAINVLDLFDDSRGIGSPYVVLEYTTQQFKQYFEYKELILNLVQTNSIHRNEKFICEFSDLDFEMINGLLIEKNNLIRDFDLTFRITNMKEGEQKYWLENISSSLTAGSFKGRFSFLDHSNNLKKDELGMQYWASKKEIWDVSSEIESFKKTVLINGGKFNKNKISLKNIYILINSISDEFEIVDESGNQININSYSMANLNLKNDIIRFLENISYNASNILIFMFSLQNLGITHSPRIEYKGIVLVPESWMFKLDTHFRNCDESISNILDVLKNNNLPSKVLYSMGDKLLPIDLDSKNDCEFLLTELRKNKYLKFLEIMYSDSCGQILNKNGENIVCELSTTFTVDDFSKQENALKVEFSKIYDNTRLKYFDGKEGWLYLKLYINKGCQNFILKSIETYMETSGLLWFFIRYEDPHPHLRIRMYIAKSDINEIFKILNIVDTFLKNQYIDNFKIETYDPEIERYLINSNSRNSIEQFFNYDSLLTLYLLSVKFDSDKEQEAFILEVLSNFLLNFVNKFDIDSIINLEELKNKTSKKKFDELKKAIKYIELDNNILKKLNNCIIEMKNYLLTINTENNERLNYFFNSIIHMHFNRLFGDNSKEFEYRIQLYRLLKHKINLKSRGLL